MLVKTKKKMLGINFLLLVLVNGGYQRTKNGSPLLDTSGMILQTVGMYGGMQRIIALIVVPVLHIID